MYTLIGRLKWYWQTLLTIVFIAAIILIYLLARSWGYDKAFKEYQIKDAERAQQSAALKQRADASDAEAARWKSQALESGQKVMAYEALGEDKKRIDENLSDKINDVVKKGQEQDANTNIPTDCNVRADSAWAGFKKLGIDIDLATIRQRFCASPPAACK